MDTYYQEAAMGAVRHSRVRFFLGFWLFVLSGVAFLDRTNISIAGLDIGRDYGLSNQSLGWIFSSFLIGYAGFQVPAGMLAARYGSRALLTLGVVWWGVATALTASLPTSIPHAIALLVAVRFLLGAGEAVIYPAANQFVACWIPQHERGMINGLIFAGVGAGSGLTPPLLTWIILSEGWRAAFWFSAMVGSLAGMVWWIFARDTPEEHPGVSRAELNEIRSGMVFLPTERIGAPEPAVSWKALFSSRDLAALMLGYFSFGYIAWVYFSWFFIYMAQVRGVDLKSSALYTMPPFLCMTVFCLAGGSLSDVLTKRYGLRFGRCYLACGSLLATAVFLIAGSTVHSPHWAVVILAGGAGTLYLSQSTFWSASIDIAGRGSSLFSSIVNMAGQVGGAITAASTPWIAQRFGWPVSFGAAAGMALVGALCWLVVHPERSMQH